MQIAFVDQGDDPARVIIERVRLLDPGTSKELSRVDVRHPASWQDGTYVQWDEIVPAKSSVKASYRISVPDWGKVELEKAGASSYGQMFVIEVELTVDGERQTVRSAEFARERPHVVVT